MKEAHPGAAGILELPFVIAGVNLRDDAAGVRMSVSIPDEPIGQAGARHALQRGVQPRRGFRMTDAGVVSVENGVRVDLEHSRRWPCDTTGAGLKRFLQIAAIAAITIFFLALFLHNANLGEVWGILKTTSPGWLIAGLIVNFAALVFRTVRWRIILDADDPPPFYPTFFANTVGYMLSTILPIRAADVARPALLARRTTHRFSGALGTVLTERVLDLFSILGLFVFFALRRWHEFSNDPQAARWFYIVKAGAVASIVIMLTLGTFMVGLFFFREKIRRLHTWLSRFLPQRFRDSWMHFFDTFVETLEITRHRSALLKVILCTAAVWVCLTGQFSLSVLALNRPLPFDAAFFVTGVTTVGLAIPTPGGIGGFHKACQLVLTNFYDFDVDSSVAAAVLFHIVGTVPVLVTGLLLFAREGLKWKDVTRSE